MVLLRDEAHVEAHFGAFGDSVNLDARYKSFWTHPMELLGDVGLVESRIGPFGDNVSVSSDRGTVCAKCTIGSEIVLDASDGSPR